MLARTTLFVPGNSPRMMINADLFGADKLVLDLEDSVPPNQKDAARILIRNYIIENSPFRSQVAVRINGLGTPFFQEDIECVVPLRLILKVPKVNTAENVQCIDEAIGKVETKNGIEVGTTKLVVVLETACGVENAYNIARASNRILGMGLGGEDLAADMRVKRTKKGMEILYSRQRVVLAAKAAGIQAYDTVFTEIADIEGLIEDATFARSLGFDGKSVISPNQIDYVNEIFSPSEEEILYAQGVVAAMEQAILEGKGVVALRGKMIDPPVYEQARQTLANARQIGLLR